MGGTGNSGQTAAEAGGAAGLLALLGLALAPETGGASLALDAGALGGAGAGLDLGAGTALASGLGSDVALAPEVMGGLDLGAGSSLVGAGGLGPAGTAMATGTGSEFIPTALGDTASKGSSGMPWLVGPNGAPGPATQWAMVLNQLKGLVPQGSQGMAGSGPPPLHASIPAPNLLGPAPNYTPPQAATMGGGGGQGLQQLLAMLQKMGGR